MLLRTQFFSPLCPNFVKEGGGQKAKQIVLFFLAQLGGEGRGSTNLGQTPKIFYFFFDGVPNAFKFNRVGISLKTKSFKANAFYNRINLY